MTMKTRFEKGNEVLWFRPEDSVWSKATVMEVAPDGLGYGILDKTEIKVIEVPSLFVAAEPVEKDWPLPPVINVIDMNTQVVIVFPEDPARVYFAAVRMDFLDVGSGELVKSFSGLLHPYVDQEGKPQLKAELHWPSIMPGEDENAEFRRDLHIYTHAANLLYGIAAGMQTYRRQGRTAEEALVLVRERAAKVAAHQIGQHIAAMASPLHGLILTAGPNAPHHN